MGLLVRQRSSRWSVALIVMTFAGGVVIRFAPLGLPPSVMKYGGSILWAAFIYWVISALVPGWQPLPAGLLAATLATAIELFKLFHLPGLDAFRQTLPGMLLLGRFFSLWDLVSYWSAIAVCATLDEYLR